MKQLLCFIFTRKMCVKFQIESLGGLSKVKELVRFGNVAMFHEDHRNKIYIALFSKAPRILLNKMKNIHCKVNKIVKKQNLSQVRLLPLFTGLYFYTSTAY